MSLQTYLRANSEFMTGKVGVYPEESRTLVGVKSERAKSAKNGRFKGTKSVYEYYWHKHNNPPPIGEGLIGLYPNSED